MVFVMQRGGGGGGIRSGGESFSSAVSELVGCRVPSTDDIRTNSQYFELLPLACTWG